MAACPKCSVENPEGAKFCFACGTTLGAVCPNCHQALPIADAKFCPSCGQRIETVEAEKLLKLVTVLFADVVSSTERAEKMYPDEIKELMESFFAAITPEITAEGGFIDSFAGDAVMAIFGVPVAHEDDALRAVRAARRMIAATERWGADKADLHKVRIRIGINTGDVLAAAGDATVRVTGDAVNVAARLESKAPVMQILIGERTARAVRNHFQLESVGGLEMKGKSEPVPGYIVGEPKEIIEERGIPGLYSPLVGRDEELEILRDALDRVLERREPEAITVMAEAGSGKSRLIQELFLSLPPGVGTLVGRNLPYGDGVTLWPLTEILMGESGALHTDPTELAREKIAKVAKRVAPRPEDETWLQTALGATLGLADKEQLDPRELFREIVDAWKLLITDLAGPGGLVVLVEDLHWADPSMLEILRLLTRDVQAGVLFVCTSRPSLLVGHPEWEEIDRGTTLKLEPLTSEESQQLIDHLLGEADLPSALLSQILQQSEGNPFYVEEILHRLIDDGYLTHDGGSFVASKDIASVEIPDTVQGVILARLDLLTPESRRVLQNAAVVGRGFWRGALLETGAVELDEALDDLERRQLILRDIGTSMAGEEEFSFKHILIRDVAYETLPRKLRTKMHVSIAGWLERTSGERADELAEVLAHHYHRAFDYSSEDDYREKARTLYSEAARAACTRFAVQQGITHGWTAIDLSKGPEELSSAHENLGDIYFQAFAIDGAWLSYSESLVHLLERPDKDPHRVRMAAKAALIATRWESGLKEAPDPGTIEKIIEEGLGGVGDEPTPEKATLLISKAFLDLNGWSTSQEVDGLDAAKEALSIAQELDDPDLASAALDVITYWEVPDGLYGQAATVNRDRLALIPRLTDIKEICDAYIVAAWTSAFAGRYREATEAAASCIESATGVEPGSYVLGLVERVHGSVMLGDYDRAFTDLKEIDKIERQGENRLPGPHTWKAYAFAAFGHELRGNERDFLDLREQIAYFDKQSEVTTREGPTVRAVALARALIHRGELEDAASLLTLEPSACRCAHLEAMCELVIARRDWDQAPTVIEAATAEATRADLAGLAAFSDRLEGSLAIARGKPEEGQVLLLASASSFAALGARWESAYSSLLAGEAGPGREHEIRKALATFEDLNTPSEIDRCRALL